MGGGGQQSSTSQQQSSVNQVQLPPWVNTAAEQNYAFAQDTALRPFQQYQGNLVADVGPQMQQAWNLAANAQNSPATAAYMTAASTPYLKVTPETLAQTNLQPYMNPYTNTVINTTLPLMQQQLQLAKGGVGDQAVQRSAFGGSRQGVQEGVADAQGALNMANMAANLWGQNFTQAQGAATGDITRNLQAQIANQGANQANINSLIAAGQGMSQDQARQFSELVSAGSLQQQQAQNEINAQMGQFNQAWNYPGAQLGMLQSALGMTPYGQTQMGQSMGQTQTQQSNDWAMTALGGLQTLGGMFGAGGPFASGGALAGLFGGSDRRLKTDITRVDTHPSGLPIYAYRYKGDPKNYPKVVGPMAEDVMKIAPHAVRPLGVGGRLGVDMGAIPTAPMVPPLAAARPRGGPRGTPAGPLMGASRGPAGIMPSAVNPPGLPASPRIGGPTGTPRGTPSGGLPGALAGVGPMGAVGALGATLNPPRIRRPRPMMAGGGKGALALGG